MTNTNEQSGVVIYLRVSTSEQANDALNLPNQERTCRNHCERNHYKVVRVFVDPGESGRTADRPEFQEMVRFCRAHRHDVEYVIVQDTSRFARNLRDQAQFIAELWKHEIKFRSVFEPNIDETAAGKLAANIHGAFNQYFSDSLSERMKERSRAAVLAGRWPWLAPPCYNNVQSKDGANIAPDLESAPLLRKCFELIATGLHAQTDVLRTITAAGLRDRKGRTFTKQEFNRILRSPVYAGWICPPSMPDVRVKGLHRPIVSDELFDAVQRVLEGKKPITAPKRKINPAFPLRGLVRCASCGTPITAALCRSRTGKQYGYYYCRQPGCRAVKSIQTHVLESDFLTMLSRLRPRPEMVSEFPNIVAEVYARTQQDAERRTKRVTAQLEEAKKLKAELLRAKLKGEVPQADYAAGNADLTREIGELERQLRETASTQSRADAFARFAQLANADLAGLWQIAGPEQRVRVRQLLFSDGLLLHPESGLSNQSKSSLFNVLEGMMGENSPIKKIGSSGRTRTKLPFCKSLMSRMFLKTRVAPISHIQQISLISQLLVQNLVQNSAYQM